MKFKCEDIWHNIPVSRLSGQATLPEGLFRISLSDFLHVWKGFPWTDLLQKRQRLERIFNSSYFDDYIILTDRVSLEKLIDTKFSESFCGDGSGFIYMYTYEDNVLAGLYRQGMLWWKVMRYLSLANVQKAALNGFIVSQLKHYLLFINGLNTTGSLNYF